MTTVALFFVVGIIFLAADVFVASFALAAVGALSMAGGCVAAYQVGGASAALVAAVLALALLAVCLYVELVALPKTRLGQGLIVHAVQEATSQPPLAQAGAVEGKEAIAVTTLAPSGYVTVEGRRYEAFCQSGHAAKGATLRVVGLDNFRLIVSKT